MMEKRESFPERRAMTLSLVGGWMPLIYRYNPSSLKITISF
jgi:hypothetical protein